MTETTYTGDDFSIDVTVTEDGSAKDITGATVEAAMSKSGTTTAITATITDAAGGIVRVSFDDGTFGQGTYDLQLRVTISGETQTVYADRVTITQSLVAA